MSVMAQAYADGGFDVVGFVGHDAIPDPPETDLPVTILRGTEIERRKDPTRVHVLEFPDEGLRILAHPGKTLPGASQNRILALAQRLNVDAIEAFNRGGPQVDFSNAGDGGRSSEGGRSRGFVPNAATETQRDRGGRRDRRMDTTDSGSGEPPRDIPAGGPPEIVAPGGFVWVAGDDAHNTNQIGGSYMTVTAEENTPQAVADAVKRGDVELENPDLSVGNAVTGRVLQALAIVQNRIGG